MIRKHWKQKPDQIEVNIDDVKIILGTEFDKLHLFLETTFCGECAESNTTIENYRIYVDRLDDLIFVGQCYRCKGQAVRVVEVGETEETAEVVRHIKMIKKKYKTKE